MRTYRFFRVPAAAAPLILLAACGGGVQQTATSTSPSAARSASSSASSTTSRRSTAGYPAPKPLVPTVPLMSAEGAPALLTKPPKPGQGNRVSADPAGENYCNLLPEGARVTTDNNMALTCLSRSWPRGEDFKTFTRASDLTAAGLVDFAGNRMMLHLAKDEEYLLLLSDTDTSFVSGDGKTWAEEKQDFGRRSMIEEIASGEPFDRLGECQQWSIDSYSDGSHRFSCDAFTPPKPRSDDPEPIVFSEIVFETDAHWLKRQAKFVATAPVKFTAEVTFYDVGVRNEIAPPPPGTVA